MVTWISRCAWRVLVFLGISRVNYYTHYAKLDIYQKYKTLIGCASEEEFDKTGKQALSALISLGLRPDSKVFDLGCGTGRLAAQLSSYLSDQGEYYGCDISAEAIEFCKSRYTGASLHFITSEMTKIPISLDEYFDFIWCYSVLTHVYPKEMVELVRECRRLLRPGGLLLASYYIAGREPAFLKNVKQSYGNRDRLEYGENFLRELLNDECASVVDMVSIQRQPILVLKFQQPPDSKVDTLGS